MFHPTSASFKHKLDVNGMLASIRQTRGRPPFRGPSPTTPASAVSSLPSSHCAEPSPRAAARSCSGGSAASNGRQSKGCQPTAHPFPFRASSAAPGIPDRPYVYRQSAASPSQGGRSASLDQQNKHRIHNGADGERQASSAAAAPGPNWDQLIHARDLSRRQPSCGSVRRHEHEEYASSVPKVLAVRYDLVIQNTTTSSSSGGAPFGNDRDSRARTQERTAPAIMQRVPRSGLRVDYYDHGRKMTIDALQKPTKISVDAVMSMASSTKRCPPFVDPAELLELVLPYCPKHVLAKVLLISRSVFARYAPTMRKAVDEAKDTKVDREERCRRCANAILSIPPAFLEALRTLPGQPPQAVLRMASMVVPLIENDAQLCQFSDPLIAWKLLRGHLSTTFSSSSEPPSSSHAGGSFLAYLSRLSAGQIKIEVLDGVRNALDRTISSALGDDVITNRRASKSTDYVHVIEEFVHALCDPV